MHRVVLLGLVAVAVLGPSFLWERHSEAALFPPDIFMSFSPSTIVVGGTGNNSTSVLTYTIENFNDQVALTGLGFSHSFPAGQQLTASPVVSNTCGGTLTANPGGTSVTLSNGATVNGPSNCQVKVNVQGTTLGDKVNSIPGGVSSSNAGSGPSLGDKTLKVNLRPMTISKQFASHNLAVNGTTTLTLSVTNPNPAGFPLAAVRFTDTLPNGMEFVSTTPTNLSCSQGTSTAGAASVSNKTATVNFPSVAGGETCTVVYTVRVTQTGNISNTTSSVQTDTRQPDNTAITAGPSLDSISVSSGPSLLPLQITKNYVTGFPGGTDVTETYGNHMVLMQIIVTNPNPGPVTNVSFTDSLPPPLQIAPVKALFSDTDNIMKVGNTNCTDSSGTYSAPFGGSVVSVSNQNIGGNGSCQFYVTLFVPPQTSTSQVTNVTSAVTANGFPASTTASAELNILANLAPPQVSKSFSKSSVQLGELVTLTVTVTNPNTQPLQDLHNVTFFDTWPTKFVDYHNGTTANEGVLEPLDPPAVTSSCAAIPASQLTVSNSSFSLQSSLLTPGATCVFTVQLRAVHAGQWRNQIHSTGSLESGSVTLDNVFADIQIQAPIVEPPRVFKNFDRFTVEQGGKATLSITVTNPNSVPLTEVFLSDDLNALGIRVTTPVTQVTSSCAAIPVSRLVLRIASISLMPSTLPANTSCTFTIGVDAITPGTYLNQIATVFTLETGPILLNGVSAVIVVTAPGSPSVSGPGAGNLGGGPGLQPAVPGPGPRVIQ